MSDDVPTSANADGVFEPFAVAVADVPWQEFFHGERYGMRFQVLSDFGGGSQITVANEVLPSGRQANQLHDHLLEEEHVFVLEGSMTVRLTGEGYLGTPMGYRDGVAS